MLIEKFIAENWWSRTLGVSKWIPWMLASLFVAAGLVVSNSLGILFAYISAVWALIALIYNMFILSQVELVQISANQRIRAWSMRFFSHQLWITARSPAKINLQPDAISRLMTFNRFMVRWFTLVIFSIVLFTGIYQVLHLSAIGDSQWPSFPIRRSELSELIEAIYTSIMMQILVSLPARQVGDIHVALMSCFQGLSSVVLFTMLIVLIQERMAIEFGDGMGANIKETCVRRAVASFCLSTDSRSLLRGAVLYLISMSSKQRPPIELLKLLDSYRFDVIEEVINAFLLKPDALALFDRTQLVEAEALLWEATSKVRLEFSHKTKSLKRFMDKIHLANRYIILLKQASRESI